MLRGILLPLWLLMLLLELLLMLKLLGLKAPLLFSSLGSLSYPPAVTEKLLWNARRQFRQAPV